MGSQAPRKLPRLRDKCVSLLGQLATEVRGLHGPLQRGCAAALIVATLHHCQTIDTLLRHVRRAGPNFRLEPLI